MNESRPLNRVIVIGSSAGGVEALCSLVRALPADLPAAVFIVQHIGRISVLPEILRRCHGNGNLGLAMNGEKILAGQIYVAAPDHHLALENSHIRVARGPRENFHRPSVDVLFRSAAIRYGPKVIGVILTGSLDDGASGIFAIKQNGGVAVVQDPKEALFPDMPLNAMRAAPVDYILPLAEIPTLLVKLIHQQTLRTTPPVQKIKPMKNVKTRARDGTEAVHPAFVCPDCDGPLIRYEEGNLTRYACKIGHRFSLASLTEAQAETLERALWVAIRSLDDRAVIHQVRARQCEKENDREQAKQMLKVAEQAATDAKVLREIAQKH